MRRFSSDKLLQIAMPMGGIGAGSVCLAGNGAIIDWSIRNKANTTAHGDARDVSAFALLRITGAKPITRLVEGPIPIEKVFDQGLQGGGYRHGIQPGLPRFRAAQFSAAYPFGVVQLTDAAIPLSVEITGFSPFIPLDETNSGIPCAIIEYRIQNNTAEPISFEFSYHLGHPAHGQTGDKGTRNAKLPGVGVHFTNRDKPNAATFGGGALGVIGHTPKIKTMWFRGGWFDAMGALWREVSTGSFKENDALPDVGFEGVNGGSIALEKTLNPGESITYPIVIAWHFPNVHFEVGGIDAPPATDPNDDSPPAWRPYYAKIWKDAGDVAQYVRSNYPSLRSRTLAFKDALFNSTLPDFVIDAIASNLAIMKSPTVLRQEDGNLWCWEGSWNSSGSCHGSCTHVWNYAQAFPHLFPALERTLRDLELVHSMDERGHVQFRAALPTGPTKHDFHAAADGQFGGMLKVFRDWQISGDRAWLERTYPLAKRSIEYCIATWDPDGRGVLSEPHHNTYDIEFWGPDGMCMSIYAGALAAMAAMATHLGASADAARYAQLAKRAAEYLDAHLFNGEYFNQKVEYRAMRDQSFAKSIDEPPANVNQEMLALLRAQGPKYQYGNGCISDGVIGAWMASLYGVESPQNADNVKKTLAAIFKYNFKSDLSEHVCTQRAGYAIGDEAGLILCHWPHDDKPTLPFVYSDEVWTGIEYQVAAHLIMNDLVDEGLTIVQAVRDRYEGHVRNPFNEYECGNYYGRALASYALLQALSGFRYSAVSQTLWFGPKTSQGEFNTFFSAASGFGTIELQAGRLTIKMIEGSLTVKQLRLSIGKKTRAIDVAGRATAGEPLVVSFS
jgi:uncharacterized protein (DUF608 family)